MLTEKFFEAPDVRLHYMEGPQTGPPLILLHGVTDSWQAWLPALPFFTQRWHVFAFDQRGHGLSGHTLTYRLTDFAGDIEAFIDQMSIEYPALVGHSMGGMVAPIVAAHTRLRGLIIGDAPLHPDTITGIWGSSDGQTQTTTQKEAPRSFAQILSDLRNSNSEENPVFLREWAYKQAMMDQRVSPCFRAEARNFDVREFWPKVDCPVLLLQADLMSEHDIRCSEAALADVTVASFEGISHELQNEENGFKVIVRMQQFLETVRT